MAEGPQAVRSIVAVAAGFFTAAVLSALGDMALSVTAPELFTSKSGVARFAGTAYTLIFDCTGGYVTALLAIRKPVQHAIVMGLILLAVSVLLTILANAVTWDVVVTQALVVPAAALGGKLREMQVSRG